MAPRTIQQRIALQGGEDVRRQFSELARAGEEAFRGIGQAAQNLRTVDVPTEKLRQQLIQLGQTGQQAFRQISQAGQTAANQISQSSQQATTQIRTIGTAAQQTANQMGTIGGAATQSLAQVQTQASSTSSALGAIRTVALTITGAFAAAGAAATGLAAAWTAMGKSASEAVLSIGRAAQGAGVSIEQFSRGSILLQQLGLTSDQAAAAIKRLADVTGGALVKGLDALEASGSRFNRTLLNTEKGRAGFATMLQGLAAITVNGRSMFDDATRAVLQFGLAFNPVTGKLQTTTVALTELADRLERIHDPAKRAQLITAIFGADLAKVLIPALQRGTAEFVNTIGQIDRLGLGVKNVDNVISQDFMRSWQLLQEVLKANSRELGLLVAKPITPFIMRFAEAMRRSGTTLEFYQQALKAIQPILDDLLKLVEGRRGEIKLAWIEEAAKQLEGLATAAKNVFFSVIVPALKTAATAAEGLARTFNEAFGTDLKGSVVAAGGLLLGLLGPLKAVGAAVLAVFGGEGPAFDTFRAKLKEFGIDVEAIQKTFSDVTKSIVSDLKAITEGRQGDVQNKVLLNIRNAIISLGQAVPGIVQTIVSAFNGLHNVLKVVASTINSVFGTNITAAGLAVVAVIGSVTGAFRGMAAILVSVSAGLVILEKVAIAVGVVLALIARVIGWPVALAAGIALAIINFNGLSRALQPVADLLNYLIGLDLLSGSGLSVATIGLLTAAAIRLAFGVGLVQAALLALAALPAIAALISAAQLIRDFAGGGGPLDEMDNKLKKINDDFRRTGDVEAYRTAIQELHNTTKDVAKGPFDIGEAWKRAQQAANQAIDGITQQSGNSSGTVANQWKQASQQVSGGFRQIAPGMWTQITQEGVGAATKTEQAFKGTAQRIEGGFRQIGPGMWEQVVQGSKEAADKLQRPITQAFEKVDQKVAQTRNFVAEGFRDLQTGNAVGQADALRDALNRIGEAARTANRQLEELESGKKQGTDEGKQDPRSLFEKTFSLLDEAGQRFNQIPKDVAKAILPAIQTIFDAIENNLWRYRSTSTGNRPGHC